MEKASAEHAQRLNNNRPIGHSRLENNVSEVKRYDCSGTMCQAEGGDWVCVELLQAAQSELAALREELTGANRSAETLHEVIGRLKTERDAAEQRNAELEKNAARYIWLRDKSESVHQFYLSTPIWFTGVKFNPENVDSTIDAAMTKPTESGASE